MNLMQNLSIKYKLITIILLVTTSALIIPFTIVIFNDLKTFRNDMMSNTIINARLMAEYCATPLEFGMVETAEEVLQKMNAIPILTAGIVYDSEGKAFASFSKTGEILEELTTLSAADDPL